MQICDECLIRFNLRTRKRPLENFRLKGKNPQIKKGKILVFPFLTSNLSLNYLITLPGRIAFNVGLPSKEFTSTLMIDLAPIDSTVISMAWIRSDKPAS